MNTYNVTSLSAALTALKPILDSNKKNTLPVLDCVRLTGDSMTATDLETGVSVKVDGVGEETFLMDQKVLSFYVTPQPSIEGGAKKTTPIETEYVTLTRTNDNRATILTSEMSSHGYEHTFTAKIFTPPVTDFPDMSDVASTERSAFAFEAFREAAKWNIIGNDPYFASWQQYVHVRPTSTGLQVLRTNGRELVTFSVDGAFSFAPFCIVPHAVKLARQFMEAGEVACVDNCVRFHSERATVSARDRLHDEYSNNALKDDDIQRIFDAPELASYVFAPRTKHDKRIALALQRGEVCEKNVIRLAVTTEGLSVVTDASQDGLTFEVMGTLLDRLLKFNRVVFRYGWKSEKAPGDHYGYLQGETVNEEGVTINYRCVVRLQNYVHVENSLTAPVNAPIVETPAQAVAPIVDTMPAQEAQPMEEPVTHGWQTFEKLLKKNVAVRKQQREAVVKGLFLSAEASRILDALNTSPDDVIYGALFPLKCQRENGRLTISEVNGDGTISETWGFLQTLHGQWSPEFYVRQKTTVTADTMPPVAFLEMTQEWVLLQEEAVNDRLLDFAV